MNEQGASIPEEETRTTSIPKLIYSALEAIKRAEGSALVKPVIEMIETSDQELTDDQRQLVDNIDWWVQIVDSGDKKRARDYYEEKLRSYHDRLAEALADNATS